MKSPILDLAAFAALGALTVACGAPPGDEASAQETEDLASSYLFHCHPAYGIESMFCSR
jgi:hypothetical protein